MPITTSFSNTTLDQQFSGTVYIGLSSTLPTIAGGNVTEPSTSGTGYARVTAASSVWTAAANREKSNATAVVFPTATASWGASLQYVVVFSAATGGTLLAWGVVAESKTIGNTDTASFNAGDFTITLT